MVDVARLYLLDEIRHAGAATPVAFEHAFGFDAPVPLELAEDVVVPLRGFVDRVELRDDGSYEIVDFKTGSSFGFADPGQDPQKVLAGGKKLQWALYAYALRQSEGWDVRHSGYRFLSLRELAERRSYPLPPQRVVANILRQVVAPARGGFFPQNPSPSGACKFCECRRACGDVHRRVDENAAAAASVAYDMNADPALRNWSRRYLE
jgi:ATP-dependent helicase/nuclease subunit B